MAHKLFLLSVIGIIAVTALADSTLPRLDPNSITASGPYGAYNLPPSATIDRSGLHGENEIYHQNVDTNYSENFPLMTMLQLNMDFPDHPLSDVAPVADYNDIPYLIYEFDQVYDLGEMRVWNYNHVEGTPEDPISQTDRGYKKVLIHYIDAAGDINDPNDWILWSGPGVDGSWQFNEATGDNDYEANTLIPFVTGPGEAGLPAKAVMLTCLETWGDPQYVGLAEVQFNLVHDCVRYETDSDLDGDYAVDLIDLGLLVNDANSYWLFDNSVYTDAYSGRVLPENLRASGPSCAGYPIFYDTGVERAIDRSGISVKSEIVDPNDPNNVTVIYQHSNADNAAMWMTSKYNFYINDVFQHPFYGPEDPNHFGHLQIDFVDGTGKPVSLDVYEVAIWNYNGRIGGGFNWWKRQVKDAAIHYSNGGEVSDPNSWTQLIGPNADGSFTFEEATSFDDYEVNTFIDFGESGSGTTMQRLLITVYSSYDTTEATEYVGLSEVEIRADVPSIKTCPIPPAYDFDGNCKINLSDFAVMANDWLRAFIYSENCTNP